MRRRLLEGAVIGLAAALVSLLLWRQGWLDRWENTTWAWRVIQFGRPSPATDRIRLIFLDQNSLDWGYSQNGWGWPWPREVYGPILAFCRRAGARAVGFDVLFTEPSVAMADQDTALGEAIAANPPFAGVLLLGQETGNRTNWPVEVRKPGWKVDGLDDWLRAADPGALARARAAFPIPEVATNATVLGNVVADADADGIYRRVPLFNVFDGQVVPSLGLAVRLAGAPAEPMRIAPGLFQVGETPVPIDAHGRAILHFRGPSRTHRCYSAAAVIQSELRMQEGGRPLIDPAELKDCYVLFGFTAAGLYDLKPTPVDGAYPAVEIHATLLDNLLWKDFMRDAAPWVTVLLALALAVAGGVLMRMARAAWQSALVFAACLPVPLALGFLAYGRGVWLPIVAQELAAGLALLSAVLVSYATEGRQKRFIKGAFRQYLSPAVIEQIIQHPERLKLGGEKRELTIFFSDVQGFTGISESLSPEALTALLNDYLSAMTDIVMEECGTVDKYEGDAIIAFWNAPLDVPDHAVRAVRAALRCQAKLAELRPGFRERCGKDLHMRVGLNTGKVVVGNMGSHNRFDYTMLGDAVNLASRLEGINKQFGSFTMMSENTRVAMGDAFPVREISRVAVVGRKEPVRVFEPMMPAEFELRRKDLDTFARGLQLFYEGRFEEAREIFEKTMERDRVAASYFSKCRDLRESAPTPWEGVWVMTEK